MNAQCTDLLVRGRLRANREVRDAAVRGCGLPPEGLVPDGAG